MIVSTPYTECYVKKSFLSGNPNYGKDETIFGVLHAIRFIRGKSTTLSGLSSIYGSLL